MLWVVLKRNGRTYRVPLDFIIASMGGYSAGLRSARMGRLSKILDVARNAEANLEQAVEADVQKYVERVEEVHKRKDVVFQGKHEALDGHVSDLHEFSTDLEDFARKNDRSGAGSNGSAYTGTTPPKV